MSGTDKGKAVAKNHEHHHSLKDGIDLVLCAASIYFCYILYGILQESIYHSKYGPEGNQTRFSYSMFLVFVQCVVNGLFALMVILFKGEPLATVNVVKTYAPIAFSYVGAMFSSNASLSFVSYPTQALAKSCKLIPVFLARIVINRKRYALREWANVIMITAGISIFMLFPSKAAKAEDRSVTSPIGLVLLFASLALDAYTGPKQEHIFEDLKISIFQMMVWINFFGAAFVFVGLMVTGEFMLGLNFCIEYPAILIQMALFSLLSALGQLCILRTLHRFNSLVVTLVTTTRKFFTILASVVWFGHVLNLTQWFGVFLVFFSLSLDIYYKYDGRRQARKTLDAAKKHDLDVNGGGGGEAVCLLSPSIDSDSTGEGERNGVKTTTKNSKKRSIKAD